MGFYRFGTGVLFFFLVCCNLGVFVLGFFTRNNESSSVSVSSTGKWVGGVFLLLYYKDVDLILRGFVCLKMLSFTELDFFHLNPRLEICAFLLKNLL